MNLSFLAPAFLAGLALLAVPLLIHLIQRQRGKVMHFPSLMFLRQVPFRTERRRRIRNWPLFLLRCAALILLVLAFSRPLIERAMAAAAGGAELPREVVILVDRSYSMAFGGRWERALDAARSTIEELRPDDRATLVFFADDAVAVTRSTAERARLLAELEDRTPGHGGTSYAPPLTTAASVLSASEQPRLEAILITDFQRAAWERQRAARLPAGAVLTPVDVSGEGASAVAVTDANIAREQAGSRERVTASARLAALGAASPGEVQVTLELDGRAVETETVTLAANSSANVTFPPFTLSEAYTRGVIRVGETGEVDVAAPFRFTLSPGGALGLLVLESPRARPATSLYLERALAIGERPGFRATTKSVSAFSAGDLDGSAVVVLNDAPFPGGESGAALRQWIDDGGGLLVALGEESGPAAWTDAVAALLPGRPGEAVDRDARGAALTFIDRSHPVFEAFAGPRTGDFSAARFFRYRQLPVAGDSTGVSVLARFDDGSPALAERRVGEGRVVVWASTLDSYWNDLPLQPVFLPFVHQLGTHLGGHRETSHSSSVGEPVDLSRGALAGRITGTTEPGDIVAVAPSGERVPVDPARPFLTLREAGFYELREPEEAERWPVVAVNPARAELELATFDPHELVAAATVPPTEAVAQAGTALPAADRERRQSLWWYILLAAFLLLASETVFSNRLRRQPRGSLIEESGS